MQRREETNFCHPWGWVGVHRPPDPVKVITAFLAGCKDVSLIAPPGQTTWAFSYCISWVIQWLHV